MSPNRRDFMKLMSGGAMSLAGVSTVVAADPELTEWEELIASRSALREIQKRHGPSNSDDPIAFNLYMVSGLMGSSVMELCPHDPETWRIEPDEYHPETDWREHCDACGAHRLQSTRDLPER